VFCYQTRHASAILLIATAISGCASTENFYHGHFPTYLEEVRRRPECISRAQIAQNKADFCMTDSNGHRSDFNSCLSAQGVPDFRINRLQACVEAATEPPTY
jgi:hypothetical protein